MISCCAGRDSGLDLAAAGTAPKSDADTISTVGLSSDEDVPAPKAKAKVKGKAKAKGKPPAKANGKAAELDLMAQILNAKEGEDTLKQTEEIARAFGGTDPDLMADVMYKVSIPMPKVAAEDVTPDFERYVTSVVKATVETFVEQALMLEFGPKPVQSTVVRLNVGEEVSVTFKIGVKPLPALMAAVGKKLSSLKRALHPLQQWICSLPAAAYEDFDFGEDVEELLKPKPNAKQQIAKLEKEKKAAAQRAIDAAEKIAVISQQIEKKKKPPFAKKK